jgi:hypothetical protein
VSLCVFVRRFNGAGRESVSGVRAGAVTGQRWRCLPHRWKTTGRAGSVGVAAADLKPRWGCMVLAVTSWSLVQPNSVEALGPLGGHPILWPLADGRPDKLLC